MTRADLITRIIDTGMYIAAETITTHFKKDARGIVDVAFDGALAEFSRDMPRSARVAGTWSGAAVSLPGILAGARPSSVEAPTGARPRTYLPTDWYDVDPATGAVDLFALATGTTYAIEYPAMHTAPDTGTATSIADEHIDGFLWLVAAHVLRRLSVQHGETMNATLQADSVNYLAKSTEYAKLADAAYRMYRTALGLPERKTPRPVAFAVTLETDARTLPDHPWVGV